MTDKAEAENERLRGRPRKRMAMIKSTEDLRKMADALLVHASPAMWEYVVGVYLEEAAQALEDLKAENERLRAECERLRDLVNDIILNPSILAESKVS